MTTIANRTDTVTLNVADAARELANSMGRFYRYVPGEGWQNRIGGDWETCGDGEDLDSYYRYEVSDDLLYEAAAAFGRLPAARALASAVLDAAVPLMTGGAK